MRHIDRWTWCVVSDFTSLRAVIELLHSIPEGVAGIPPIASEVAYQDIVSRVDQIQAEVQAGNFAAAKAEDVSLGGCYSPGPAGVQVWDGPWNGEGGRVGTAAHLGSVDWSWDSPAEGFVTIYRVLLTVNGSRAGLTTHSLLDLVLNLTGLRPLKAVMPLPRPSLESLDRSHA